MLSQILHRLPSFCDIYTSAAVKVRKGTTNSILDLETEDTENRSFLSGVNTTASLVDRAAQVFHSHPPVSCETAKTALD